MDPEILLMQQFARRLDGLDDAARERITDYLYARYGRIRATRIRQAPAPA